MNSFTVITSLASVAFHYDGPRQSDWSKYEHYGLFCKLMNYLGSIGFAVSQDPEVLKKYHRIHKDHYYGRQRNLEFKANRYPAGFNIEFFQNIVHENKCGGYYDFDKYEKMPYLIKKQFDLTARKISRFLLAEGIQEKPKFIPKTAEEYIKHDFAESWHHPQKDMKFELSDLDGQTSDSYNNESRDGSVLHNGDIKYFRGWNGYLNRGRIYHNINNMWWVITDSTTVKNVASFELFDYSPIEPRRLKKGRLPEAFKKKMEVVSAMSTKELERELRRRKNVKAGKSS
jgi:hypothetical protein